MEGKQSFIFPVHRAQWLTRALSLAHNHHAGGDISNEIVVLSTGIDQYIQEVFHHLSKSDLTCCHGDEEKKVSSADFAILCHYLGLTREEQLPVNREREPTGITFREFHSRLIECFSSSDIKDDDLEEEKRNRWNNNSGGVIEANINVRHSGGISVRHMCSNCFKKRSPVDVFHSLLFKCGNQSGDWNEGRNGGNISAEKQDMDSLEEENNNLRELVEDMRVALQSSDARCLALLVEVRKLSQGDYSPQFHHHYQGNNSTGAPSRRGVNPGGDLESVRVLQLVKELARLRDERDRQLEEAILFAQQLEVELWSERRKGEFDDRENGSSHTRDETYSVLLNQLSSARSNVQTGLDKVRLLEIKQSKGLLASKAADTNGLSPTSDEVKIECQDVNAEEGITPELYYDYIDKDDEDEEDNEEENEGMNGRPDDINHSPDVSKLSETSVESASDDDSVITSVHCGDWYHSAACPTESSYITHGNMAQVEAEKLIQSLQQLEEENEMMSHRMEQLQSELAAEIRGRDEDRGRFVEEMKAIESERFRLSSLEDELGDVILLLGRVREMNLSKRSLGRIVFDIVGRSPDHSSTGYEAVQAFIHSLHKELLHSHLLLMNGNVAQSRLRFTSGQQETVVIDNRKGQGPAFHCIERFAACADDDGGDQPQEAPADEDAGQNRPNCFPVDLIKTGFEMKC
ncbi:EF-hand and coiled-coil domain-containing protein 1-like [Diadema setosum]|uniref:EF-hand and coiled-coil domain-containing protein 1-like n=1 Tax=Diadema setosum TaxID=31175 RepID=UPI003B3B41BE